MGWTSLIGCAALVKGKSWTLIGPRNRQPSADSLEGSRPGSASSAPAAGRVRGNFALRSDGRTALCSAPRERRLRGMLASTTRTADRGLRHIHSPGSDVTGVQCTGEGGYSSSDAAREPATRCRSPTSDLAKPGGRNRAANHPTHTESTRETRPSTARRGHHTKALTVSLHWHANTSRGHAHATSRVTLHSTACAIAGQTLRIPTPDST